MKTYNRKLEKYLERKLQRRHDDIEWKVEVLHDEKDLTGKRLLLHVTSLNGTFYFGDTREEIYINYMVSDILKKKRFKAVPNNTGEGFPVLNWGSQGNWILTEEPADLQIAENPNSQVECPVCEHENNEDEEFCQHCDAFLYPEMLHITEAPCHNCDTHIPKDALDCRYCGARQFSFLKQA